MLVPVFVKIPNTAFIFPPPVVIGPGGNSVLEKKQQHDRHRNRCPLALDGAERSQAGPVGAVANWNAHVQSPEGGCCSAPGPLELPVFREKLETAVLCGNLAVFKIVI